MEALHPHLHTFESQRKQCRRSQQGQKKSMWPSPLTEADLAPITSEFSHFRKANPLRHISSSVAIFSRNMKPALTDTERTHFTAIKIKALTTVIQKKLNVTSKFS